MPITWDPAAAGVLLDLDETLVLSSAVANLRRQRRWADVYQALDSTYMPPGTGDFISAIGQLGRLGVITMAPRPYAERVLAHHGLKLLVVVAYHDVANRKPHPDPILRGAQQLGVAPAHCVYIGDAGTDLVAADAAGAIPIGISWDGTLLADPRHVLAFALCRDWAQVLSATASALTTRLGGGRA